MWWGLTVGDAVVRHSEAVSDLLPDPHHLWPLLEMLHLRQSQRVSVHLHHKPGALLKESHQGVVDGVLDLLIWGAKEEDKEPLTGITAGV